MAAAAVVPDGGVMIIGGSGPDQAPLSTVAVYRDGAFASGEALNVPRSRHSATVLRDGRVLVVGGISVGGAPTWSAELFDPAANRWTQAGEMATARAGHTASLLADGRVLIAGGASAGGATDTLEIFDPANGSFSAVRALLSSERTEHAAAVLEDGRVLIAGGTDGTTVLASVDVFNPADGTISATLEMATPRSGLTATMLLDGAVLIAGGTNGRADLSSAEIFHPDTGRFSAAKGGLVRARSGHLAFALPDNNNVLIVGGTVAGVATETVEMFKPTLTPSSAFGRFADRVRFWSSSFSVTGSLRQPHADAAGVAASGQVLIAGGNTDTAEIYTYPTIRVEGLTVSGANWEPGQKVTIRVQEETPTREAQTVTVTADAEGRIAAEITLTPTTDEGRLFVTATSSHLQAQTASRATRGGAPAQRTAQTDTFRAATDTDGCKLDQQGPDDISGGTQRDLNEFCHRGACTTVPGGTAGTDVSVNFDDTSGGGGSRDACYLFDTNNNGFADRAVCVSVTDSGVTTTCYTCPGDSASDRCVGRVANTNCSSSCTVINTAPDPFTGQHSGSNACKGSGCTTLDSKVTCCIATADDGGRLIDVCAFNAGEPNSSPHDCIIQRIGGCTTNADCTDDGNVCTTETCNTSTGVCSRTNNSNSCNDGNACTTVDACQAGACVGTTPVVCAAPDQCHDAGVCDPTTGTCSNPAKTDGTACNDNQFCTTGETCQAGVCAGTPNSTDCSAENDQCNAGVCNEDANRCEKSPIRNGLTCEDNQFCTTGEVCQGGSCVGAPNSTDCSAQNDQCNAGVCNEDSNTCEKSPIRNGLTCEDNQFCTTGETCQAGSCVGPPNSTDCSAQSDQCNVGVCNEATDKCEKNPAPKNGQTCTDGNRCTQTDTCVAGVCAGANPVICMPLDQCHIAGVCDPATGNCSNPPAPAQTVCSDNDVCSSGDQCDGNGSCQPGTCSACTGKVTGGGQVATTTTGGKGTFGFNARNLGAGLASGHFNWVDHATGCHVNGPVHELIVCGNKATFTGTCGPGTTCGGFTVTVTDMGEPGKNDSFGVTIVGACQPVVEQKILRGNIQIHR